MKPALAAIPDAYVTLAMGSDVWFWFVTATAVMIHAMQVFERAVLRLVEAVILYPFRRILYTYQHSDPTMIEYYSATCAITFGLWVMFGRTQQALLRQITDAIPWWLWSDPSVIVGIFQGLSVQYANRTTRAFCGSLALTLWAWLSIITFRRMGFNAIHAFTIPLMLACWITIFVHLRGANGHGSTTASSK